VTTLRHGGVAIVSCVCIGGGVPQHHDRSDVLDLATIDAKTDELSAASSDPLLIHSILLFSICAKIKFVLWICNGNRKCLFIIYEQFRLWVLCFLFSYNLYKH
jgi:hypothetical protein